MAKNVKKDWDELPGFIVPFDWRIFFYKQKVILDDHGVKSIVRPTAFHLISYVLGQIGWAFDQLLYPDWQHAPHRGPIFILGAQRSGTTFLHHLLAEDLTHARSLTLQEMLLPATSIQRIFSKIKSIDEMHGGKLKAWFEKYQEKKYGPLDHIHKLRFNEIEEDEFVLYSIFSSDMCVNDSPISVNSKRLDHLRFFEEWPVELQIRAFSWYRACILKKIYREPNKKDDSLPWYVSKNPRFSQRIPQLIQAFPNALLIYMVRNPLETIPSRLSMLSAIWCWRYKDFDQMSPNQVESIVSDSTRSYLLAERDLANVSGDQKIIVKYPELVSNPALTVKTIYSHFNLPGPDEKLSQTLNNLCDNGNKYKSKHKYHSSEYKIDEHRIREELSAIFAKYSFE